MAYIPKPIVARPAASTRIRVKADANTGASPTATHAKDAASLPPGPPPVTGSTVTVDQLQVLESGFKQRARVESNRFKDVLDSEYWVCLCFESRAQKEQFLAAVGVSSARDGDKYLDGVKMAAKLGIPLTRDRAAFRAQSINRRWLKHVSAAHAHATTPARTRRK